MRRFFIFLLVVLLVLTSCSTGKVKQEEPQAVEVVTATPEKAPEAGLPASVPSVQPESGEEESVPASGEQEAEVPEVIIEVLDDEEVIVVSESEDIDEQTAEEIIETLDGQDWSTVITATAPEEKEAETEEKPVEEAKVAETQISPAQQTSQTAQEAPATQTTQTTQTTQKTAEKKAPSKIASFFSKIGNFVMKEKLLSIGLLVCAVGVVYLIVALVLSGRPKKHRRPRNEDAGYSGDDEEETGEDEEERAGEASQEDVQPGDDDEFLRSLLGDEKK